MLLFAALVHIADPGQALAIVVPICLIGGRLVSEAADALSTQAGRWQALAFLLVPAALFVLFAGLPAHWSLLTVPLVCWGAGVIATRKALPMPNIVPRAHAVVFLLCPALLMSGFIFFTPVWYSTGPLGAFTSGLAATSLAQIRGTLAIDDANLRTMQRLAAERPGQAVVVWERGLTSWRKTTWYAAKTPVVVLEHQYLDPRSPAIVSRWQGPHLLSRTTADTPVRLEQGTRIIWFVNSAVAAELPARMPVRADGTLHYTDLPATSGAAQLGRYRIEW
jgi:hypothetical protein